MLSHSIMSNSLRPRGLQPAMVICLWNSPGKNTGVGCHVLLQGIFLTQGWNSCLLCLPALAGGFFTSSTTWEAPLFQVRFEQRRCVCSIPQVAFSEYQYPTQQGDVGPLQLRKDCFILKSLAKVVSGAICLETTTVMMKPQA